MTSELDLDGLVGLAVDEAKERVAEMGMHVKVVDDPVTVLERGINRITLSVKDGVVIRAGGFERSTRATSAVECLVWPAESTLARVMT